MEVSHSSFCSDRPRPPGFSMFPAGSSDSLDISHLIPCNTHDSETLLSTALSVASIESAYSLTDVPSFRVAAAPHRKLHIKYRPILITNDPLNPTSPARSRVTVTVPTPPRLRTMLMEPICISHWNVSCTSRSSTFNFQPSAYSTCF